MAKKRIKFQGILMFVSVIGALLLTKFVFPDWKNEFLEELFDNLGIILILFGFLLRILARGYKEEMSRNGHKLVIEGPYSLMRNPMYFGTLLIGVGAVSILVKWWVLPVFIALYSFIYLPQINKEEKILLDKFGKDYKTYCKVTPKYLPKILALLNFRKYIPLLKFSWVKKESPSLAGTMAVVFLIEIYQDVKLFGAKELIAEFLEFLLVVVIFSVITLMLTYNKPMHKQKSAKPE
jgi:protein-S-isoprenylcysteine O-methyltransferase Ste14